MRSLLLSRSTHRPDPWLKAPPNPNPPLPKVKEWEAEDSEEWETEDWDDIPIDTVQMVVESSKAAGAAPATALAVPMAVPGRTSPAHARPLADAAEAPFVARALREVRAA